MSCSICFETLNENSYKTKCGHDFDAECLLLWINFSRNENHKKCPLCRCELDIDDLKNKYLDLFTSSNLLSNSLEDLSNTNGVSIRDKSIIFSMKNTDWINKLNF